MKLLRYNSNREVSGPIILLRLTPLLVSRISKNYCLNFVIQGFLGVAKNLFAAALFLGSTDFMVFDKKHDPFSHFYGPYLYLYFYLIFHAANKRIFLWHGNSELLDILALV